MSAKKQSAIYAGDIKEMVERLTDLMKQTLVPVNQAIEQYYSMELRFLLSVFSGDEFLYAAAESCGYPNMGICSLLVQCDFPSTKMIEVSRKMSKLNLVTYINPII